MIRGIFYKEWLKTKWFILIGTLATTIILFIWSQTLSAENTRLQPLFFMYGIAAKNRLYQVALKFLPPTFALILALFQFIPEIGSHKYRLTILLPANENKLVAVVTGYGYLVITVFSLILVLGFYIISSRFLPLRLILSSSTNLLTWILAGYITYSWLTAILFEPTWKNRIFLTILGITAITLALWKTDNSTTLYLNILLIFYVLTAYFVPYYTIYRLRKGKE